MNQLAGRSRVEAAPGKGRDRWQQQQRREAAPGESEAAAGAAEAAPGGE